MRLLRALLSSTELASTILLATSYLAFQPVSATLTFPSAPAANLDISQLGRVAVVGDFAGASLFQYSQQTENSPSTNGTLSLLSRFPSGAFATLEASDAYITAMCALQSSGKLVGVLVGGNFTGLGGVMSPGLALFNPDTSKVQAISGLNGKVNALYCDSSSGIAYVGGLFTAANSSNAIAWTSSGFQSLPFTGFNGAVMSITKDSGGNIVFAGSFDGLGNMTTPQQLDGQRIPLTSMISLEDGPSTTQAGLGDIANIICKANASTDGPGNAWLLADNTAGSIVANFGFGFNPSLLRIGNTNVDGFGTKTWRFTALPINGILNFSYVDSSGNTQYCDAECPLAQGDGTSQDFHFVNVIGMSGIQVNISDWYGGGGGLSNLEMYQNDIYVFSVNDYNEPACGGITYPARASTSGTWTRTKSTSGTADYLSASLTGNITPNSTQVVFTADIKQSGNYTVYMFTPGCLQDNSCNTRGRVTVSSSLSSTDSPTSTDLFQTNNYDKYDQVYSGHVDITSDSFKPTITLTASAGQTGPLTIVAQRVRLELITSSGGLNGLFEYNPSQKTVNMNFKLSTVDSAATSLNSGAHVNSVVNLNGLIYAGGIFQSGQFSNFLSIGSNATTPANSGLNGPVQILYGNGSTVYVGGSFNGTRDSNGPPGLNGIAAYNTNANSWSALGAGVRGNVMYIVPFQINLSASKNTDLAIALSGQFDQILGFNGAGPIPVNNFAVWIPSKNNWLQNLNVPTISVNGILTAQADVPNEPSLFAGSVASYDVDGSNAVEITGSETLGLEAFPVQIQVPSTTGTTTKKMKRATASINETGVLTGLYYNENNKNLTVLGGHFTATASSGSTINNLLVIDGSNSDKVSGVSTGISADSTIRAVAIADNSLFAGGSISGTVNNAQVNGLFVYDISTTDFATTQPQTLQGNSIVVNAMATQPKTQLVYVGGSFTSAGSFPCPALCIFDNSRSQWTSPASNFDGTVVAMEWVDDTHLLVAGNLTINGTSTPVALYDSQGKYFSGSSSNGAPSGTITAVTPGSSTGTSAWIGGSAADGSPLLAKWDGTKWTTVTGLGSSSVILGLQIFTLTSPHGQTTLLDRSNALMVFGSLNLPNYGNASAALYNGTAFQPFLLTSLANGGGGSAAGVFVANPLNFFMAGRHHLALGFIVLIGLAISLALIFLIIAAGMAAEILRRKRQGYVQAPSSAGQDNLQRIPPEELLGGLAQAPAGRGWSTQQPAT